MVKRTAPITGITGQDGCYLIDFLFPKGGNAHLHPASLESRARRYQVVT